MNVNLHAPYPQQSIGIHVCGFFVTLVVTILIVVHVNSLPTFTTYLCS